MLLWRHTSLIVITIVSVQTPTMAEEWVSEMCTLVLRIGISHGVVGMIASLLLLLQSYFYWW